MIASRSGALTRPDIQIGYPLTRPASSGPFVLRAGQVRQPPLIDGTRIVESRKLTESQAITDTCDVASVARQASMRSLQC
jgi:hypothetical protein